MHVSLISPPVVESSVVNTSKASGLAHAGEAFRAAGLDARLRELGAEVSVWAQPTLADGDASDDRILDLGRYNALIAREVTDAVAADRFPALAGGTCSHLVGMLSGLQQAYGGRLGLIWLDAHGDFNTPRTSHSGMLGGMPVAVSAGMCHAVWRETAGMTGPIPTDRIVMVDVRNLDEAEAAMISASDISVVKFGADGGIDEIRSAIEVLAGRVDHVYLHVDSDVLDASLQPNHPSVEPDGPDLAATLAVLRAAIETGKVRAFGVVSVNPDGDGGEASLASGLAMITGGLGMMAEAVAASRG